MFPLQRIQFENHKFLAANKEKEYLKMTYGEEFMKMPKKIKIHGRMPALINTYEGDLHKLFVEELEIMSKTNENFE